MSMNVKSMPTYDVVELEDTSTGVVKRRRMTIVVPVGLSNEQMTKILVRAMKDALKQSPGERLTNGPIQKAHVFAWTDRADVGLKIALWRAVYVRDDSPDTYVSFSFRQGEQVRALGGTISIAL
jgi:hypothetical protein